MERNNSEDIFAVKEWVPKLVVVRPFNKAVKLIAEGNLIQTKSYASP